ncbi:unnamed protein product [Coregonus sp. 'balchen']|nr:unnamed protein product [Coregonus sp. 'balchen']
MYSLIKDIRNIQQCIDSRQRVVSSFTLSTNRKLPDLLSGLSDCPINIIHPYVDDCKEMCLMKCVDQWTLINMENLSQTTTIEQENKSTITTSNILRECDSEVIGQTYKKNVLTSVDELIRKCKGKSDTVKNDQKSISITNTFHNITNQGPQKVILESLKGSVTSHQKNNLLNFRMALPSTNNATLEKMDDIWLEIPTEAFNDFLGHTKEEVNLGVFWFENDSLFPVEENNTKLLNSRVVSVNVGEDFSDLSNNIKITFRFQNASLILLHNGIPLDVSLRQRKIKQYALVTIFHSSQYLWVGCGISLCFLCLALLIHLRRGKSDDSLCIHIHLCVALLCLNLTFLTNDSLASLGVHGLCVATATATHYSLLCTLTWFSLEGFHLYLLIIRVFNIHINRYLLKLGLVGWGIPGIVVIIIVACGKYGEYNIYQQDGGAVKMCWLTDSALTTVSFSYFVLTFVVNVLCFGSVTVKVVRAHRQSPVLRESGMSRGTVLSLLGLAWLLGVSWGVLLFQFGPLKETAFYIFCTVNSLHGFFLFLRYWALTRPEKASISTATTVASSTEMHPTEASP